MRGLLICLAMLLCVGLSTPLVVRADTPKKCADFDPPKGIPAKRAENPNVSIVPDAKTAWQPVGGTVNFTVHANAPLNGLNILVCFACPPEDWKTSAVGEVSLTKAEGNSATYSVTVPELGPAPASWKFWTGLGLVPVATMRIIGSGGAADPPVDVAYPIGITSPLLALLLALLAVAIAFWVFYAFARNRGVPGRGLLLWMISTRNGVASLSQAQIMLWTFLIGALAIYVMSLSGALIDITNSTLVLLGIAGVATIGSKLQNAQQDAKGATPAYAQTALPGKVPSVQPVAGATTDSEVRLAWAAPTTGGPVMGYKVEYQQTAAAGAAVNTVWNAVGETIVLPHHTVLGLAPATNYQFRVRAVNAGGQSADPAEIGPIQTQALAAAPSGAPGPTGGLRIAGPPTQTAALLAW
jgi:hypothetical protein